MGKVTGNLPDGLTMVILVMHTAVTVAVTVVETIVFTWAKKVVLPTFSPVRVYSLLFVPAFGPVTEITVPLVMAKLTTGGARLV